MTFQKNIFQVWFQGCDKIEDIRFKENIKQWKLMNPEWNYRCLNDYDLFKLASTYSKKCEEAYTKAAYMVVKVDLGKLLAIYFYGGIMVDMDMFAFRPLSYSKELTNIIENEKDFFIISKMKEVYSFYIKYNNAVVISNKGNKLLKKIIDIYIDTIFNTKKCNNTLYVNLTTGPIQFNKIIKNNSHLTKVIPFNYEIFESCNMDGLCNVNENTISLHKFEMSWMHPTIKQIIQHASSQSFSYYIIIFLIILIIFAKYNTKKK